MTTKWRQGRSRILLEGNDMKTRLKTLIVVGILMVLAMGSAWLTAHHQPQNADGGIQTISP